ncbi:uncharacterized protein LOC133371486 isoform X2 [Rhineura floridana]|uniref:uncharacterized protein LOC133371486 isoform X2 n=1 Tax=Rhineura floridana TaxID=261503 RepID=UPI002AC84576|nr:uncharacterized protein LOC133371486 isoform X2 [Rhineura floridana]
MASSPVPQRGLSPAQGKALAVATPPSSSPSSFPDLLGALYRSGFAGESNAIARRLLQGEGASRRPPLLVPLSVEAERLTPLEATMSFLREAQAPRQGFWRSSSCCGDDSCPATEGPPGPSLSFAPPGGDGTRREEEEPPVGPRYPPSACERLLLSNTRRDRTYECDEASLRCATYVADEGSRLSTASLAQRTYEQDFPGGTPAPLVTSTPLLEVGAAGKSCGGRWAEASSQLGRPKKRGSPESSREAPASRRGRLAAKNNGLLKGGGLAKRSLPVGAPTLTKGPVPTKKDLPGQTQKKLPLNKKPPKSRSRLPVPAARDNKVEVKIAAAKRPQEELSGKVAAWHCQTEKPTGGGVLVAGQFPSAAANVESSAPCSRCLQLTKEIQNLNSMIEEYQRMVTVLKQKNEDHIEDTESCQTQ